MRADTFAFLRCPYCGGRLELVEAIPHRRDAGGIVEGVLGCHCCTFPVVEGIPVMHLQSEAVAARAALEAGHQDRAFQALLGLEDDAHAARFREAARSPATTYRDLVEMLGERYEGGYFLYHFSDPSYVVAHAVVGPVAAATLAGGGRAIDVCGGSGHLTRSLVGLSTASPVIADLYFAKLWLAARFVAPGCEPVCCDGNAPLPFARGAFRFAMCADAFMFIWTKRQLVSEMVRLIDGTGPGAVVITHAHNAHQWSLSWGQPLPPEGYRDLFEALAPQLFAEGRLLDDVVAGGPLDLSRRDGADVLDADAALTIIATRDEALFRPHPLTEARGPPDDLRFNPLYAQEAEGGGVRLRLRFPSEDYEEEYGASRRYLPEEVTVDRATRDALGRGERTAEVAELLRRRIVLEMPKRYY